MNLARRAGGLAPMIRLQPAAFAAPVQPLSDSGPEVAAEPSVESPVTAPPPPAPLVQRTAALAQPVMAPGPAAAAPLRSTPLSAEPPLVIPDRAPAPSAGSHGPSAKPPEAGAVAPAPTPIATPPSPVPRMTSPVGPVPPTQLIFVERPEATVRPSVASLRAATAQPPVVLPPDATRIHEASPAASPSEDLERRERESAPLVPSRVAPPAAGSPSLAAPPPSEPVARAPGSRSLATSEPLPVPVEVLPTGATPERPGRRPAATSTAHTRVPAAVPGEDVTHAVALRPPVPDRPRPVAPAGVEPPRALAALAAPLVVVPVRRHPLVELPPAPRLDAEPPNAVHVHIASIEIRAESASPPPAPLAAVPPMVAAGFEEFAVLRSYSGWPR